MKRPSGRWLGASRFATRPPIRSLHAVRTNSAPSPPLRWTLHTPHHHFQRADDARAVAWLLAASERARRAYAWLSAAERLEAARRLRAGAGAGARERGWLTLRLARLRVFGDT